MGPPLYDVVPDRIKALVLAIALCLEHLSRLRRLLHRNSTPIATQPRSPSQVQTQLHGVAKSGDASPQMVSQISIPSDPLPPIPVPPITAASSASDNDAKVGSQSEVDPNSHPPSPIVSGLDIPQSIVTDGASRAVEPPDDINNSTEGGPSSWGARTTDRPTGTQLIENPRRHQPLVRDDAILSSVHPSTVPNENTETSLDLRCAGRDLVWKVHHTR